MAEAAKCGKPSFDTLDEWSAYEAKLIYAPHGLRKAGESFRCTVHRMNKLVVRLGIVEL
jgi:hypothetical protein